MFLETSTGVWTPIEPGTIAARVTAMQMGPEQWVRIPEPGGGEITTLARNLPEIPRRELFHSFRDKINRFLTSAGDCQWDLSGLHEEAVKARGWVPEDPGAESYPKKLEAELAGVRWFKCAIDFAEGFCYDIEDHFRFAEACYQAAANESSQGKLWFAAKHQLSVLHIRQGHAEGVEILCDLIDRGVSDPTLESVQTDYTFAEIARCFREHGCQHSSISNLLMRLLSRGNGAAPDGTAVDWQSLYLNAESEYRQKAIRLGFGEISDFNVVWDGSIDNSGGTPAVKCGWLRLLGRPDILESLSPIDAEVQATHDRLRKRLELARGEVPKGNFKMAIALLDAILDKVKGKPEFAGLHQECERARRDIAMRAAAAEQQRDKEREREVLQKLGELENSPGVPLDVLTELVAVGLGGVVKEASAESSRRQAKAEFDAGVRKLREALEGDAEKRIECLRAADGKLTNAIRLDKDNGKRVAPIIAAGKLMAAALGRQLGESYDVESLRSTLCARISATLEQSAQNQWATKELWKGISSAVEEILEFTGAGDDAINKLVDDLCQGLDVYRYDEDALTAMQDVLRKIRARDVTQARPVVSSVQRQLTKIQQLIYISKGERLQLIDISKREGTPSHAPTQAVSEPAAPESAADYFCKAINLDPGPGKGDAESDAKSARYAGWQRLIEYRVGEVPELFPSQQRALLAQLEYALSELTTAQRLKFGRNPDGWIKGQIETWIKDQEPT